MNLHRNRCRQARVPRHRWRTRRVPRRRHGNPAGRARRRTRPLRSGARPWCPSSATPRREIPWPAEAPSHRVRRAGSRRPRQSSSPPPSFRSLRGRCLHARRRGTPSRGDHPSSVRTPCTLRRRRQRGRVASPWVSSVRIGRPGRCLHSRTRLFRWRAPPRPSADLRATSGHATLPRTWRANPMRVGRCCWGQSAITSATGTMIEEAAGLRASLATLATWPRGAMSPHRSSCLMGCIFADYSPVTSNFPYPEDVISHTAVGTSPRPSTSMGRW